MDTTTYWNEIGVQKEFEDPFYLEKLQPYLEPHSTIIEYGCGYGRLMHLLDTKGYKNLIGFDTAVNMIEKGTKLYPELNLVHIEESGCVPVKDAFCDALIASTILCCVVHREEQQLLVEEFLRILKPGGVLYLTDFVISNHPGYADKYKKGYKIYNDRGIYTTSEGLTVRHHATDWVMQLLERFNIQWFEQFDFKTMNQNYARTFHCVAQKPLY